MTDNINYKIDYRLIKEDLFYRRSKIVAFLINRRATIEAISKYCNLSIKVIKNELNILNSYIVKEVYYDITENQFFKRKLSKKYTYSINLIPSENDIKNTIKDHKKIEYNKELKEEILELLKDNEKTVSDLSINIFGNSKEINNNRIRRILNKMCGDKVKFKEIIIDRGDQKYNACLWSLR